MDHDRGSGGGREKIQYTGQKRQRDEEVIDAKQQVIATIFRAGDVPKDEEEAPLENDPPAVAFKLLKFLQSFRPVVQLCLLDCSVELTTKTPTYAAVIGLLNVEAPDFVAGLVAALHREFQKALAAADSDRARMLLRLAAALTAVNVVQPGSYLAALSSLASAAVAAVQPGEHAAGVQPYADTLVSMLLMSLPWADDTLVRGSGEAMTQLLDLVGQYMEARPVRSCPALAPFLESGGEDDLAAQSDSGAATFLPQLWEAFSELRESGKWNMAHIPRLHREHEARLAEGQPHELPALDIPAMPACVPAEMPRPEVTARVLAAFPPRGGIQLLPREQTQKAGLHSLDHIVAQQLVLDTVHFFDGDRVQCARRLAQGLPMKEKLEGLLAETLFSQLLCLPRSRHKALAYSTIMVDLCKLLPTFPRPMSACVRECFQRMGVLDPELRGRLAAWLALHLAHFEFMWPWDKWRHVLDLPPHNAQRRFIVLALSLMLRLSYHSRVKDLVPPSLATILPPPPELISPTEPAQASAPDQEHANGVATAGDDAQTAGDGDVALDGDATSNGAEGSRLQRWSAEILELIRQKRGSSSIIEWALGQGLEDDAVQWQELLRAVTTAILTAGAKTITHMATYVERFEALMRFLMLKCPSQAEDVLAELSATMWAACPQRACHAIDAWSSQNLLSGKAVARWAFQAPGFKSLDDELAVSIVWTALTAAVLRYELALAAAAEAVKTAQSQAEQQQQQQVETGDVAEAQQSHDEALQELQELLLQVFTSFRDALEQGAAVLRNTVPESKEHEAAKAWQSYTLAQLRCLARRFQLPAATASRQLSTIFAHDVASEAVRSSLHQLSLL